MRPFVSGKTREYVPGKAGHEKPEVYESHKIGEIRDEIGELITQAQLASDLGDFDSAISLRHQIDKLKPGDAINSIMKRDLYRFAKLKQEGTPVRTAWPKDYLHTDYLGFLGDCPTSTLIHYSKSAQNGKRWDDALIFQGLLVELHPDNDKMRTILNIIKKQKQKKDGKHASDWSDWPADYRGMSVSNILENCTLSTFIHYSRLAQARKDWQNALLFQREVVRQKPNILKGLFILSYILERVNSKEFLCEELETRERMTQMDGLFPDAASDNEKRISFLRESLKDHVEKPTK